MTSEGRPADSPPDSPRSRPTATANRIAVKHAHSEQNPEKDWGTHTLQAVEFAFWVLNERYGSALPDGRRTKVIVPANSIVIASSVSNGTGAALANCCGGRRTPTYRRQR